MVRGKGYIMAAKGIFSRRENAQQYKMQWGAPVKWASRAAGVPSLLVLVERWGKAQCQS